MAPEATTSSRTQAERRKKSEQALLEAAAVLIAERGVERTSLARIGEAAGTSRGLPSHHFRSKDALIARLAQHAQDRVEAATLLALGDVEQWAKSSTALDFLRVQLETYIRLFERPSADERALIVMWGATFPSQASIEGMREADQRNYDGTRELIRRGQEDGSIRADLDPTATSVVLFGMMRGVAALLLTESHLFEMGDVRATCDAWIVAALSPLAR